MWEFQRRLWIEYAHTNVCSAAKESTIGLEVAGSSPVSCHFFIPFSFLPCVVHGIVKMAAQQSSQCQSCSTLCCCLCMKTRKCVRCQCAKRGLPCVDCWSSSKNPNIADVRTHGIFTAIQQLSQPIQLLAHHHLVTSIAKTQPEKTVIRTPSLAQLLVS